MAGSGKFNTPDRKEVTQFKVYEFGKQNKQIFVMFQCAVEPWWAFESSAKLLAHEFHVFLFITDGHDETGSEFTSLEHSAKQSAEWMKENGIDHIDIMYGVSMGGAGVIRFLATEQIKVEKAIIDAGITPYTYPKIICRLISFWDFISVSMASKNLTIMKMAMPPEKWTPKGENPEEHYKKILRFEKNNIKQDYLQYFLVNKQLRNAKSNAQGGH